MARLDFFIISQTLLPFISKTGIEAGTQSDHSITSISIDFAKFTKGRGFWKFNNSLLKDKNHIEIVNQTIIDVTKQYALNVDSYPINCWSLENIENIQNKNKKIVVYKK